MRRLLPLLLTGVSIGLVAGAACSSSTTSTRAGGPGKDESVAPDPGQVYGELELPPSDTLVYSDGHVEAWAMTEVPASSRRQAAFAMVDAIARAELLKVLRVGVESVALDYETNLGELELQQISSESTAGVVLEAGPSPHGYRFLRRDGEDKLQVWTRLRVPVEMVSSSVQQAWSNQTGRNVSIDADAMIRAAVARTESGE
ncbi:MAG: hypothetical protein AAFP04_06110 [Myxococcota bacterium]